MDYSYLTIILYIYYGFDKMKTNNIIDREMISEEQKYTTESQ